jgi:hypothetical protein
LLVPLTTAQVMVAMLLVRVVVQLELAVPLVVATQLQEAVEPRVQVMAQLEPMAFVPKPD